MAARELYYSATNPAAFSTLQKFAAGTTAKSRRGMEAWFMKQQSYTLHRPVRKRFPKNPYTVTYVMDVYKYKYKYLLTVMDVWKLIYIVQLRLKTGTDMGSEFRSILAKYSKPQHRRPIWVRIDRVKEFLNRSFQDMLKKVDIQFQECREPNVKCAILERSHRTILDKLYKYITFKNM